MKLKVYTFQENIEFKKNSTLLTWLKIIIKLILQFEVIICNDWLQQTCFNIFTFYVNLSDLLFVWKKFSCNHYNKVFIKSTANSMITKLVSWVLHKIKKEDCRDIWIFGLVEVHRVWVSFWIPPSWELWPKKDFGP